MKKKQWYVFTMLLFLLSLFLEMAGRRPDIKAAQIGSLSDLAFWIDNNIEQGISLISIVLALGCLICSYWAED